MYLVLSLLLVIQPKKIVAECPLCAGPFLGTGDKAVNKTSEKSLPSWDTVASGDRKGKSSDFQF